MQLVIVESPTKAKSISHFLGKEFKVIASYGHVRDLPKSKLGIDVEKGFAPHYIIPTKARKKLNEIKKLAKESEKIILATDEDREGEAIAFHLTQALDGKPKKFTRIAFHEITEPAIKAAMQNPRDINLSLVDAQQARRILDRLVGYELSPFLWKKIFRGLSAGRVQSPALRLIVEREKEKDAFQAEKYYTVSASLEESASEKEWIFDLQKINDRPLPKPGIATKKEADKIQKDLRGKSGYVLEMETKNVNRHAAAPFTTSTLQQSAWQILHFSAKKTMRLAQSLYEGKSLGTGASSLSPGGPVGLITYMRTDSTNISPIALKAARDFIKQNWGEKYVLPQPRLFKKPSRLAQEAHEAIRCTDPFYSPEKIKKYLAKDEWALYTLIWSRFIASQMPSAILEKTSVSVNFPDQPDKYLFKNNFYALAFDGFFHAYPYSRPVNLSEKPSFAVNEKLKVKKVVVQEHLTQPPARYNDASLVKTLESFGIGRPSTYAPIISVLEYRGYVLRDKSRSFIPTEVGVLVNDVLTKHFTDIVDYKFTSQVEAKLDDIAAGKLAWVGVVEEFYQPFKENLEKKYSEVSKEELAPPVESDEKCPKCDHPLVIKLGRFGRFLACSNWPKCSFTKSINSEELSMKCPKCKTGDVVMKRNKKGQMFYACSRWPDCDFASSYRPTGQNCPQCQAPLVETKTKIKCSNKNCDYETSKTTDSSGS